MMNKLISYLKNKNKSTLDQIEKNQIYKIKEYQNFNELNIDVKLLNSLSPNLSFNYITIDEKGGETNSNYVKSVLSFVFGFLIIHLFLCMVSYGHERSY